MKPLVLLAFVLVANVSFSQVNSIAVKDLKDSNDDALNFVYSLPYEKGKSYLFVQAPINLNCFLTKAN